MRVLINDQFSFRSGESFVTSEALDGCTMAVMLAPVQPLPEPARKVTDAGDPVEPIAVIAAELREGLWQWLLLSPHSKEAIGDHLMANGAELGRWYGCTITRAEASDGSP